MTNSVEATPNEDYRGTIRVPHPEHSEGWETTNDRYETYRGFATGTACVAACFANAGSNSSCHTYTTSSRA